jgi:hypothetical protein
MNPADTKTKLNDRKISSEKENQLQKVAKTFKERREFFLARRNGNPFIVYKAPYFPALSKKDLAEIDKRVKARRRQVRESIKEITSSDPENVIEVLFKEFKNSAESQERSRRIFQKIKPELIRP